MRAGRFVVPVRQECRSSVAGLVHDVSSSGATLFVEPLAVMQANNELARLHAEEEEEIAAILRALSVLVGSHAEELAYTLHSLAQLDFIQAKARLSAEMRASACQLNDNGQINLKQVILSIFCTTPALTPWCCWTSLVQAPTRRRARRWR